MEVVYFALCCEAFYMYIVACVFWRTFENAKQVSFGKKLIILSVCRL